MTATEVERLAALCTQRKLTVAVAESLTAGLLASAIGEGPDAKDWFCGGIIAYRTEVKEQVLHLPAGVDPCSASCARQLALGARELLSADLVVATTGVGGSDPEDGHPPGTVYLGSPSGQRRDVGRSSSMLACCARSGEGRAGCALP